MIAASAPTLTWCLASNAPVACLRRRSHRRHVKEHHYGQHSATSSPCDCLSRAWAIFQAATCSSSSPSAWITARRAAVTSANVALLALARASMSRAPLCEMVQALLGQRDLPQSQLDSLRGPTNLGRDFELAIVGILVQLSAACGQLALGGVQLAQRTHQPRQSATAACWGCQAQERTNLRQSRPRGRATSLRRACRATDEACPARAHRQPVLHGRVNVHALDDNDQRLGRPNPFLRRRRLQTDELPKLQLS